MPMSDSLQTQLAQDPARLSPAASDLQTQFEQAQRLAFAGQTKQAIEGYVQLLHQHPQHYPSLVNVSVLLLETGFTSAAKTALQQAIRCEPQHALAHVNYANLLFQEGHLDTAQQHYEHALANDPDDAGAHRGLARLYFQKQAFDQVWQHHRRAYAAQPLHTYPYAGPQPAVRLLILIEGLGGDLPWERIIDRQRFEITTLVVHYAHTQPKLPEHDLILNAVGDADLCQSALQAAQQCIAQSTQPVLNAPSAVALTGRLSNAQRLGQLPRVKTARMQRIDKNLLAPQTLPKDWSLPVLVRSPGFQTGQFFEQVSHWSDLPQVCDQLPGNPLLLMEHLDGRDAQGWYRKYRVMCIGQELYPLHLALSRHWKVHYFSADMAQQPAHRALEAEFLQDMSAFLGPTLMQSLKQVQTALGLDYGGIDFGIDAQGQLLIYEANATMVMALPPQDPMWDYRRAPIARAIEATQRLLFNSANTRQTHAA